MRDFGKMMGLEDFDVEIKFGDGLLFETGETPASEEKTVGPITKAQDEALKEIIRSGFRAPVGSPDTVFLVIDDIRYAVFNLSVRGIGIFLKNKGDLEPGSTISRMRLTIQGKEFMIDGRIVHISREEAQFLCGIDIVEMDEECKQALFAFLQASRSSLFTR